VEDLTAWLRATIEGDKAAAEANGDESWTAHDEGECDNWTIVTGDQGFKQGDSCGCCCKGTLDEVVAKHMALHDPRDTIARCEAELELLDLHKPGEYGECVTCHVGAQSCGCCGWGDFPCDTVKLLARGYQHRPGFKPSWLDG